CLHLFSGLRARTRRARRSAIRGAVRDRRQPVPCTNQVEVQQQRNRLDTRKWALSKLAPRKYGDRVEHDVSGGGAAMPAILIQVGGVDRGDVIDADDVRES